MAPEEDEQSIIIHEVTSDEEQFNITSSNNNDTNLGDSHQSDEEQEQIFKLSGYRWLMLFAVFSFGLSNGISDTLAPILNIILELLSITDLKVFTWITSGLSYLPLLTTLPTAWFLDKYGLKFGMQVGAVITILRNGSRALLFAPNFPFWIHLRYLYWISAHVLSTIGITVFFCLPLKVSETWFKESERFTAWAVMLIAVEVGAAITAYLLPIYITGRQDTYMLSYVYTIDALILCFVVITCVKKPKPSNPASHRIIKSDNCQLPFITGLKVMLTHKDYLIHLLYCTVDASLAASIYPIIQDILAASGYDNHFCGQLISVQSLASIVFLFVSSYSVVFIGDSAIGCKVLACLSTIGLLLYLFSTQLRDKKLLIVGASLTASFLRSIGSPSFQNMSAHLCNGVIRHATISGISITIVFVLTSIYTLTVVYLRTKLDDNKFSYTGESR